jgi:hypothetical protein
MAQSTHGSVQDLAVTAGVTAAGGEELTAATLFRRVLCAFDVGKGFTHLPLSRAEELWIGADRFRIPAPLEHTARRGQDREQGSIS